MAAGSYFRLRASDVQGRHGANFELLFVVVVKLVGHGYGLLLDFNVFARVDELPVGVDGVGDGGDGLIHENQISDLAIILGNHDIAAADISAKAVQQLLAEGSVERGLHARIKKVGGRP